MLSLMRSKKQIKKPDQPAISAGLEKLRRKLQAQKDAASSTLEVFQTENLQSKNQGVSGFIRSIFRMIGKVLLNSSFPVDEIL
jgi:hypothetical protein